MPEDARDQVLARHQAANRRVSGPLPQVAVPSTAIEQAAAADTGRRVENYLPQADAAAALGQAVTADDCQQAASFLERAVAAPSIEQTVALIEAAAVSVEEKPYVPVRAANRRIATLPGGTAAIASADYLPAAQITPGDYTAPTLVAATGLVVHPPTPLPEPTTLDEAFAAFESSAVAAPLVVEPTLADLPIGHADFEYLSGTAGTGKTFTSKQLLELSAPGTVVLAATTGIASVNLGEGTTVHSLLGFFNTADLQEKFQTGRLQRTLRLLARNGLRRILIDEVSMMDGRVVTILTRAVAEVNQPRDKSLETLGMGEGGDVDYGEDDGGPGSTPAGELPPQLALTLVGDFAQLPPVPDTDNRTNEKIPATFAFESPEWHRYAQHTHKLTKIYRQTDVDFVQALHAVRRGDLAGAMKFFTPDKFSPTTDLAFDGTTIFAKNIEVDRHNQLRLDEIRSEAYTFEARRWGTPRSDWKQIPDRLQLKDGALVMILANRRVADGPVKKLLYANGDLGQLIGRKSDGSCTVELKRNGQRVDVVLVQRENVIPCSGARRKEIREYEQRVQDLTTRRDAIATSLRTAFDLLSETTDPEQAPPALTDERRVLLQRQATEIELALQRPRPCGYLTEDGRGEIIGTVTYMPLRVAYAATVHKCLLAGTRVTVIGQGLVPVEEVRVGDVVDTGQGHRAAVIAAQPTGLKELVTVRFKSGRELQMSPDHPLLDERGIMVVGARVGQKVQLAQQRDFSEHKVALPSLVRTPRGSTTVRAPQAMDWDLAYGLGLIIGDGSIRDQRDGTIEFHAREPELREAFATWARGRFGVEVRRYPKSMALISRAVRNWLLGLGLGYVTSEHKTVPECVLRASTHHQAGFLRGLFDTDGCVDKRGYIRYVTTSKVLAQQVQLLLGALGITETTISSQIPTVVYRGARRQGHRAYTVRIHSKGTAKFAEIVGFRHVGKAAKVQAARERGCRELPCNVDSGILDEVVEVVRTGLHVPLHDLEVEGADHSFVANGLIVSNTQGLTLDRIQVNIRDGFFKQPGMLFVALSRARTPQGLRIVGDPRAFMERCRVDGRVVPWL